MDRLLSLLLTEMDGAVQWGGPPVVILGATRDKSLLDPAILRPGRLDIHVHVPRPDAPQRAVLLRHMLERTPVYWQEQEEAPEEPTDASDVSDADGPGADGGRVALAWLVERSAFYTLAQLSALCREAAMAALREDLSAGRVLRSHFESAADVADRALA